MRRDALDPEDLEIMAAQQMIERAEMIVAQMLVIDGVVLHGLDQRQQVMGFRDEDAVVGEQVRYGVDHGVRLGDVSEHVGGRDDARLAVFFEHLARGVAREVGRQRVDALLTRDRACLRRLDAEHAVAAGLEILQQRAVVRADIDDQAVRRERDHVGAFPVKIGEVLAQDARRAAEIRIAVGEQNLCRHLQADLDMAAAGAAQHLERIGRLLDRHAADFRHGVHRRDIAEEQHRIQRLRAANLATPDRRRVQLVFHGHGRLHSTHAAGARAAFSAYQRTTSGRPSPRPIRGA